MKNIPMKKTETGLTLVEILVASVLGVVIVGTAVALVPKGAQQASAQTQSAVATAHVNQLTQAVEQQFKRGTFAGFSQGNSSSLNAIFTTGSARTLPKQDNLYSLKTLNVPGLDVPVGGEVLLVTSSGLAKLVKVTDAPGGDRFTFDCPTGLPSNTEVKAFPAQSLGLSLAGDKLTRTVSGVSQVLGDAAGASFAYVYQESGGAMTQAESAAATTSAGKLVGFMPVTTKSGVDRTSLVSLPESRFTRLLSCTENAASTLNDARLNVTVSGLPGGAVPAVSLHGPDSNIDGEQPLASHVYQGVKPGSYSMTADDVQVGENIYRATVKGSPATLYNTWGDAYLQAAYSVVKGRVTFRIEGLPTPPPTSGAVHLSGPDNKTLSAENGTPELKLTPGDYAITADQIGDYIPAISTSTLHVNSSTDTEVVVQYALPTGMVNFQITGLPTPPPENGFVRITGPENKNVPAVTGTADATFKAGSYTISADPIGLYEPVVTVDGKPQSSLTVIPKGSSTVRVNYALATGPLSIEVKGLPAGTSVPLTVSGPQTTTVNAPSGSVSTATLQVGSYTITAPEVTVGSTKYLPSPASAVVSLGRGGAGHVVTYAADPGAGMPVGGTPPGSDPPAGLPNPGAGEALISLRGGSEVARVQVFSGMTIKQYQVSGGTAKLINILSVPRGATAKVPTADNIYYRFGYSPATLPGVCKGTGSEQVCSDERFVEAVHLNLYADTHVNKTFVMGETGLDAFYRLAPGKQNTVAYVPVGGKNNGASCYDASNNEIPCPPGGNW